MLLIRSMILFTTYSIRLYLVVAGWRVAMGGELV